MNIATNLTQVNIRILATLLMASGLSAQSLQTLYSIAGGPDGFEPSATVTVGAGGVLYGMTYFGGNANSGTIFSLKPPSSPGGAWTHAVLYDFTGGSDGQNPYGTMAISPAGVLYGTTENGGAGNGVAFSLTPPTSPGGSWTETVMHAFTGGHTDGATPEMGLLRTSAGVLYGTAAFGGKLNGGIIFSLVADGSGGWNENVLHSFGAPFDGIEPQAAFGGLLVSSSGVLYGTTVYGGLSGSGTIYSLADERSSGDEKSENVLYSFTGGSDGGNPTAGLTAGSDGTLYGTTSTGGLGGGTVFSLTPPASSGAAWTLTVLSTASAGAIYPSALLLDTSSNGLYGTTNGGGKAGDGTIFRLRPPATTGGAWQYKTVYAFSGADGANPIVGLVPGPGGKLYGTTVFGGSENSGTVFRLSRN